MAKVERTPSMNIKKKSYLGSYRHRTTGRSWTSEPWEVLQRGKEGKTEIQATDDRPGPDV